MSSYKPLLTMNRRAASVKNVRAIPSQAKQTKVAEVTDNVSSVANQKKARNAVDKGTDEALTEQLGGLAIAHVNTKPVIVISDSDDGGIATDKKAEKKVVGDRVKGEPKGIEGQSEVDEESDGDSASSNSVCGMRYVPAKDSPYGRPLMVTTRFMDKEKRRKEKKARRAQEKAIKKASSNSTTPSATVSTTRAVVRSITPNPPTPGPSNAPLRARSVQGPAPVQVPTPVRAPSTISRTPIQPTPGPSNAASRSVQVAPIQAPAPAGAPAAPLQVGIPTLRTNYATRSVPFTGNTREWSHAGSLTQGVAGATVRSIEKPERQRQVNHAWVVFRGRRHGVFTNPATAKAQTDRWSGNIHKGYCTLAGAYQAYAFAYNRGWCKSDDPAQIPQIPQETLAIVENWTGNYNDLVTAEERSYLNALNHIEAGHEDRVWYLVYAGIKPGIYLTYLEVVLNVNNVSCALHDTAEDLPEAKEKWAAAVARGEVKELLPRA